MQSPLRRSAGNVPKYTYAVDHAKPDAANDPTLKLLARVEKEFRPFDLDDLVHEAKIHEAMNINNAGLGKQFDYLVDFHGVKELEEMLFRK